MNSFFPDAINSWNNIITNYQNLPSFTSLKAHILSLIRPKIKSTFGIHDPLGLRYIFQLRVKLSPLRNHKRHHNFADTPSEICECNQDIEDTPSEICECNQDIEDTPSEICECNQDIEDTPSEICECNQDIEDTRHFLFECRRYARQRAILAIRIIEILQQNNLNHLGNLPELYLYGHKSLNVTDNKSIVLSTIKYIKDTQRFVL